MIHRPYHYNSKSAVINNREYVHVLYPLTFFQILFRFRDRRSLPLKVLSWNPVNDFERDGVGRVDISPRLFSLMNYPNSSSKIHIGLYTYGILTIDKLLTVHDVHKITFMITNDVYV